jgi:hypothetical protein
MSKRKFEVEVGYSVAYQSVWLEVEADDEEEAREAALDDFYDKVYIDSPLVSVVYMNELSDESEEPSSDD